ncbi:MAG: multicopper oxidase domain-containing protein [Anaerolineae bacterium]
MRTRIRSLALMGGLFLLLVVASLLFAAPALADLPASPCTPGAGTTTCELWAMPGTLTMPDGTTVVNVWGFAADGTGPGQVPGPMLLGNEGETMEVILHNQVPGETVALAFPGQELLPDLNGVATGETATYTFDLTNPGTFLYEAGLTANGTKQVAMGLYGALVVSPTLAPGTYDDEVLLVLGEVDPVLNNDPGAFNMYEYAPRYGLINGQAYPDVPPIDVIPGQTLLLRYVNGGLESHWMGLLGLRQQIVASDGQPLPAPYGVVADTIAAGQTVDALATIPTSAYAAHYALYDTNLLLHNANERLITSGGLAYGGMMTFLQTAGAAPPALPAANNVLVSPNPTTGVDGVTLSAAFTSGPTQAEFFTDTVGLPGTGTSMVLGGPGATVDIPAATLATWPSGFVVFYVRGTVDGTNWGPVGSTVLNLDKLGPNISGMGVNPEPSNGTQPVLLRATGDDHSTGRNNVISGTYSVDGMGPLPMVLSRMDNPITAMTATLTITDLAPLAEGLHPIDILAQDSLLNWGTPGIITLTLDQTGPDTYTGGSLTPAVLDLSGAPPVTAVRLEMTISDALSAGVVQSTLANAEAFIDTPGPDGSGFDLFPADGLFDEITEDVYFDIPVASFLYLSQTDPHTVTVHGLDIAGNWGITYGEVPIVIDRGLVDTAGPTIAALTINFTPAARAATVEIAATADDPNLLSNVVGAEWFVDVDPGEGLGTPLEAADGAFDATRETLVGTVDVGTWTAGEYTFYARALDSSGFWGPTASATIQVDVQETFFIYLPTIQRNR